MIDPLVIHNEALQIATARLRDAQTRAEAKTALREVMRVRAAGDDKVQALKAARESAVNPDLVQSVMIAERKRTMALALTLLLASLAVLIAAVVIGVSHHYTQS